jgi:hypothetical protein
MVFTPSPGNPSDDSALGANVEIWNKATGGGSAITLGRVVVRTDATGNCAEATDGSFGRFGVVARLYPNYDATTATGTINVDSSSKVAVICGSNAKVYVTCTGSIPAGSRVVAGTTGTVKAYVESAWTSTTPGDFQSPLREFEKIVGVYEGHYGESEQAAGSAPTAATTGQVVRIKLGVFT